MNQAIIACSNLITKDNKFLLVKESKETAKDTYNFPSGTLEMNETLIECAIREAKEETGLNVEPVKILKIYQNTKSKSENNVIIVLFQSQIISGKITTSKEHPEVKFASFEEIKTLANNNLIRDKNYMLRSIETYKNKEGTNLDLLS